MIKNLEGIELSKEQKNLIEKCLNAYEEKGHLKSVVKDYICYFAECKIVGNEFYRGLSELELACLVEYTDQFPIDLKFVISPIIDGYYKFTTIHKLI